MENLILQMLYQQWLLILILIHINPTMHININQSNRNPQLLQSISTLPF